MQNDPNRKFVLAFALVVAFLSMLPMIIGSLAAPYDSQFIGYPFATDDHMVYAAWMRQAQDGHFLFDNRFAVDAQPTLTINIYFFVLGLISKLTGIAWATTLAKALFSAIFVFQAHGLIRRLTESPLAQKIMLFTAIFGAGIGFTIWHRYGVLIVRHYPEWVNEIYGGRLPIDVWQPEAFVFPSMLTNSLFMVSLCLIMGVINCILESRHSWRTVPAGAAAMLVLMNIHSYDVLILVSVALAFAITALIAKHLTFVWFARCLAIFSGAIPSALWFVHVLRSDPVFQARAATPTFSPTPKQLVFGMLLLVAAGLTALAMRGGTKRSIAGVSILGATLIALACSNLGAAEGYAMGWAGFALLAAVAIGCIMLVSSDEPAWNWVAAWAIMGIAIVYFPALFQRKLAMGLSIPWGILAGWAIYRLVDRQEVRQMRLSLALSGLLLCATSFFWLQRELYYIAHNVSRTTVQPLFLDRDVRQIIRLLNEVPGRKVVICQPGSPTQSFADDLMVISDTFEAPLLPDLNPILSGLAGAYTYAGHWSETPDYLERRKQASRFFMRRTTREERQELIQRIGATHLVSMRSDAFGNGNSAYVESSELGEVLFRGKLFELVRLAQTDQ